MEAQHTNKHPVDIYVGQRLRERRSLLGMSQDTLGRAVGVTFQQIQKYERGTNRIGSSRLYEFAMVLTVSVDYFFNGFSDWAAKNNLAVEKVEAANDSFPAMETHSKESLQLVKAYYQIKDPAVRNKIAQVIKVLGKEKGDTESGN